MRGGAGVVGSQVRRTLAQLHQGGLQPRHQTQEGLRETTGRPLPIRIRQHTMAEEVIELLALNRDPQLPGIGPVQLHQLAGLSLLRKEHLPLRTLGRPPMPRPPVKGAQVGFFQPAVRTRPDPLDKIWDEVVTMLQDAPELEAKTLFEYFLARPDSGLEEAHLRTFYRRARHWRATQGPEREVFFAQERKPGELMQLDWTYARELRVTIQGQELDHLLCHCVLPYSNWEWATRCISECFLSLVAGLQAALGQLGK